VLAHSFGKACIVSSNSGVEDTADSDGAFFYDPADDEDLPRALQGAIDQRDRLAQMGAYNRVNAEQRNWQDVAESTLQLYRAIQ
jgi:glycosyltransferase involved in cell wall biosynthesis